MATFSKPIFDEPQEAPKETPKAGPSPVASGVKFGKPEVDLDLIVERAAKKYDVDPRIIRAIITRESSWNPGALGPEVPGQGRALGLMQLMPDTARRLGIPILRGTDGAENYSAALDPETNIDAGTRLFAENYYGRAGKDLVRALKMYHGGLKEENWGEKTNAYAQNVLSTYRDIGGRQYDPEVGTATWGEVLSNAVAPVRKVSEAIAEKLPDLRSWSTKPDGSTRRVGPLTEWWRGEQKPTVDADSVRLDKRIANFKDENPWGAMGLEVAGAMPLALGAGAGANALIRGVAPVVGEAVSNVLPRLGAVGRFAERNLPSAEGVGNFLLGRGGYGAPGTAEGASTAGKLLSGAAQGGVQGAAGALATAPNVDAPLGEQVELGGALGIGLGGLGTAVAQTVGRGIYGPRIHPQAARLGQEVMAGDGVPQMALHAAPKTENKLALSNAEVTRRMAETFGETRMPVTPAERRVVEARIGQQIESGARAAYIPLDDQFLNAYVDVVENLPETVWANPALQRVRRDLIATYRAESPGVIPGEDFLSMTSRGAPGRPTSDLARALQASDPEVRHAAVQIRNMLHEQLERGAQENIRRALANGDAELLASARSALENIRVGREHWRNLKITEDIANDVTGEVQPKAIAAAVERHLRTDRLRDESPLAKLGRAGSAFDETNMSTKAPRLLPLSGVAAGAGALMNAPVTTGQAALGVAGTVLGGKLVLDALRNNQAYSRALLRRSAAQRPGALQSGLARTTVPLVGAGGNMLFASPPE